MSSFQSLGSDSNLSSSLQHLLMEAISLCLDHLVPTTALCPHHCPFLLLKHQDEKPLALGLTLSQQNSSTTGISWQDSLWMGMHLGMEDAPWDGDAPWDNEFMLR